MSQYHVYENSNEKSKKLYPFFIDIQSTIVSDLESRIVIPLIPKEKIGKGIIENLNPMIVIKKKEYILVTQQMAAIPIAQIGSSICDCLSERNEILSAVDFLITGI